MDIESKIIKVIQQIDLPQSIGIELEHPAQAEFGDYACNIALQLFPRLSAQEKKDLQASTPLELAQGLASQIKEKISQDSQLKTYITSVTAEKPGFINFELSDIFLSAVPAIIVKDSNFGKKDLQLNQTWEIEHTSPNPNKAMHLGHLRNNVTAMAISNLWQALNIKVVRDAVDNNRGIAIAKLMWGYLKFAHKEKKDIAEINYWFDHQDEWLTPQDKNIRPDKFVDELYLRAAQDFEDDEQVEKKVRQLVIDWESGDKKTVALWKKVLSYSYQGQEMTLTRLGNQWDNVYKEHEHYQQGKKLVEQGLKKGVFVELENVAILSNLQEYDLPDTIVQKADGTSLYITQDLALTKIKKEKLKADKLFWVVGPEQTLALRQMFAICEQLGIAKREDLTHITYGYMSIKGEGKMSSRAGNVVYIDELIEAVKQKVLEVMTDTEFSDEQRDEVAEQVALGAIKYSILKVGRMSDTAFDFETALRIDGNSGPYLQYTQTRSQSVLSKSDLAIKDIKRDTFVHQQLLTEEKNILRHIYKFPDIVEQAGLSYEPSVLANFLYELAQRFNSFYNKHHILTDTQEKEFRLLLTASVAQVLKTGLDLLGIKTPQKM